MPASAKDSICPRPPASRASARISCAPSRRAISPACPARLHVEHAGRLRAPGGLNPTEVTRLPGRGPLSSRRAAVRRATVASAPAMPGRTVAPSPPAATGDPPGSYRDDYAGSPPGRSGLGGSSACLGRGGSAAPVHQPRPRAPGPGHRGEHRPRICCSSSWAPSSWPARPRDRPGLSETVRRRRAMCPRCPASRRACRTPPAPIPVPQTRAQATQRRPPSSPWRRRAPSSAATTCPRAWRLHRGRPGTARPWRRAMSPGPRRPISM